MSENLKVRLCEFATVHVDGTYTLVRGGIETWLAAELPVNLVAWAFIEISAETLGTGKQYPFRMALTTPSGVQLFKLDGMVAIKDQKAATNFAVPLQAQLQDFGAYVLEVGVDVHKASAGLLVKTSTAT